MALTTTDSSQVELRRYSDDEFALTGVRTLQYGWGRPGVELRRNKEIASSLGSSQ